MPYSAVSRGKLAWGAVPLPRAPAPPAPAAGPSLSLHPSSWAGEGQSLQVGLVTCSHLAFFQRVSACPWSTGFHPRVARKYLIFLLIQLRSWRPFDQIFLDHLVSHFSPIDFLSVQSFIQSFTYSQILTQLLPNLPPSLRSVSPQFPSSRRRRAESLEPQLLKVTGRCLATGICGLGAVTD